MCVISVTIVVFKLKFKFEKKCYCFQIIKFFIQKNYTADDFEVGTFLIGINISLLTYVYTMEISNNHKSNSHKDTSVVPYYENSTIEQFPNNNMHPGLSTIPPSMEKMCPLLLSLSLSLENVCFEQAVWVATLRVKVCQTHRNLRLR